MEQALQAERDCAVQECETALVCAVRDLPAGVVTEARARRVTSIRSVEQEHIDGDVGLVSQLRQYCESEPVQGRLALLACAGTFGEDVRLRCFEWKWRLDNAKPCGGHWYVTGRLKDVSEILQLCRGFELDHQVESLRVVAEQAGG